MLNVADPFCECCTEDQDDAGGLCAVHIDMWMRSPERRAIPNLNDYEQWTVGLERFIKRVRREGVYVN